MNYFKKLFEKKPTLEKCDLESRFQLLGRVGQGSMSKVWKALDNRSQKLVAVKVLDRAKLIRLEERYQKLGLQRPTEGAISVVLNHPYIVRSTEHGVTTKDEQFIVMEYLDGVSLSFLVELQNQRMKANCLSYIIQLGEAMCYLHQNEWIHRDLCPRNVIIATDDVVKLIDFGLMVPNTPEWRRPGNRTGTANYMAPELIKRLPTDQRIDVFSFAVTCFEMYSKALPWPSGDTLESVVQHVNNPPHDIRDYCPGIDEQLAQTIMKGLLADPDQRWRTMRRMVNEFIEVYERLYPE